MKTEVQARMFEPFYSTKARGVGTGLGLATVFGIVKQSGGHIYVYSEPGRGTTVKVYLPRGDGAPAVPTDARRDHPRKSGTETIVVVEDDASIRMLVQRVLLEHGYPVVSAATPAEAVTAAGEQPLGLLLTDVMLPGMSGPDLASALAATQPDLPVLYMSGYTDMAVVEGGHLDPEATFLPKPFGPETLLNKVREAIEVGATSPAPLAEGRSRVG